VLGSNQRPLLCSGKSGQFAYLAFRVICRWEALCGSRLRCGGRLWLILAARLLHAPLAGTFFLSLRRPPDHARRQLGEALKIALLNEPSPVNEPSPAELFGKGPRRLHTAAGPYVIRRLSSRQSPQVSGSASVAFCGSTTPIVRTGEGTPKDASRSRSSERRRCGNARSDVSPQLGHRTA
jgi:hypothetical protein